MPPVFGIRVLVLALVAGSFASSSSSSPLPSRDLEAAWSRLRSTLPAADTQEAAAKEVVRRLLPRHASAFDLGIVSLEFCGGRPCFHITSSGVGEVKVRIQGTTGVELCAGFHWYLKSFCGAHLSWDATGGAQLGSIPDPQALPAVQSGGLKVQRPVPWSYYQNVVTSSYSYAWWDWTRWEKEIDWMALQGINLPLAFTGQEAVWQKVFQNTFNLTKEDLDDYFGGPAFLAWARMANLHGWGGPLPQHWLDSQLKLQKQILRRMRRLGMVAGAWFFSSCVQASSKVCSIAGVFWKCSFRIEGLVSIREHYTITGLVGTLYFICCRCHLFFRNTVNGNPKWCCNYLLQPTDPLFRKIGKAFIDQQIEEYGFSQHVYNCDTFNENLPPTNDPEYISSLAEAVYDAMVAADEDAIWLMQGWLFSSDADFWKPPQMQALLHAVPFGRMVVLDLFAEVKPIWSRSNHFYGVPYIWCMLHNFGGNHEMYGRLDVISSGPVNARTNQNSTMVGVGLCMEGIEQNPVVYELMSEMAFRSDAPHLQDWLNSYAARRYGFAVPESQSAWQILSQTVYNCSDGIADHNTDVVVKFPDLDASTWTGIALDGTQNRRLMAETSKSFGHLWYPPSEAKRALSLLLAASTVLGHSGPYRYDLVDLTRQVLSKRANEVFREILVLFSAGDVLGLQEKGDGFIGLISDLERLLRTNEGFLLGPWLEAAKRLATNKEERDLYEWNARTQITMWYDNTDEVPSGLHDYANKMWSGLMKDYYLPRASLYLHLLQQALKQNKSFPYESWRRSWISLTSKWQNSSKSYPTTGEGDSVEVCKSLYAKYASLVV